MIAQCPQCSAHLSLEDESFLVRCPFCQSSLYLELGELAQHLLLQPLRTPLPQRLSLLVNRWLKEQEIPFSKSSVSFDYKFLPFWLHYPEGHPLLQPAFSNAPLGVKQWHLPPGDFTSFNASQIPPSFAVIEPDVERAASTAGLLGVTQDAAEAEEHTRLVHLPFAEVTYRSFRRIYSVLLDLNGQHLYADSLPPSLQKTISLSLTVVSLLLFAVFFGLSLVLENVVDRFVLGLPLAAASFFLIKLSITRFGI